MIEKQLDQIISLLEDIKKGQQVVTTVEIVADVPAKAKKVKPEPEPKPEPDLAGEPEKQYTVNDAIAATQAAVASKGREPVLAALKKFGAARASELKEKDFAAYIEELS